MDILLSHNGTRNHSNVYPVVGQLPFSLSAPGIESRLPSLVESALTTRPHCPPLLIIPIIGLSLSHLVSEILWPKVRLIVHQNVLLNRFKAFYINFPLICYPMDLFLLILNLFDLSFSQNLRSDLLQFLFACWTRVLKIWWSTPPQDISLHVLYSNTRSEINSFRSFKCIVFRWHLA